MKIKGDYNLNSLALVTDLILLKFESEIIKKDDYIVIKTPSQPDYFWGNFLIFSKPPKKEDFITWKEIYKTEFESEEPNFFTLTWDSEEVDKESIISFEKDGFSLGLDITLATCHPVKPSRFNEKVVVKPIETNEEWAMIPEVHFDKDSPKSKTAQMGFAEKRIESFREFTKKGVAHRFGAFLNGKLVGDLGLFYENEVARFDLVATHSDYLRQGICQTLVYLSSIYMQKHYKVLKLVIVADDDYYAIDVYKKVGFKPIQKNYSLMWWNKEVYGRKP
jgi:uncharacterized protein YrzB (UPF0473 family)